MAERFTMSLHNAQQAHQAIQAAWRHFIDLLIELERKKLSTTAPSTLNPEGWHACGNVGMEASE